MSRPDSRIARTRSTRVALVVGAMIGALALAGCGAGQVTQTAEQVAAVNGANATVGTIAVRNAQIEYNTAAEGAAIYLAGTSAPLEMVIVNTGDEADRLLSASSPIASAVEITGDTEIPGGQTLVVEGAPAEAVTAATGAAVTTPSATPTATPTTTPAPTAGASGEGPTRRASIVLTGLRQDLQVGPTYPVVLTFERAGDVRMAVPIGNPESPREDAH